MLVTTIDEARVAIYHSTDHAAARSLQTCWIHTAGL